MVNMNLLIITILCFLLLIACYQDTYKNRITNSLTLTGALIGVLLTIFFSGDIDFIASIAGWCIGLMLFLPFYLLRLMGAGDVKLLAMVGSFVGANDIFYVFIHSLIAGGLLALIFGLHQRQMKQLLSNAAVFFMSILHGNKKKYLIEKDSVLKSTDTSIGEMPYALAITCGTVFFVISKFYWH